MAAAIPAGLAALAFGYLAWCGITNTDPFLPLRGATFTGRTDLWSFVMDEIAQRPWFGAGYSSFWAIDPAVQPSLKSDMWFGVYTIINESHQGYLELLATGGVAGFAGGLLVLFRALALAGRAVSRAEPAAVAWRTGRLAYPTAAFHMALLVGLVVHNFTESNLFSNNSVLAIALVLAVIDLEKWRLATWRPRPRALPGAGAACRPCRVATNAAVAGGRNAAARPALAQSADEEDYTMGVALGRMTGMAIAVSLAAIGTGQAAAPLTRVAGFDMQVTGVAVSRTGRIFVNFPRWEKDVPISVAEVGKDGRLTPFPDAGWNSYSNLKPLPEGDHFVCVQSVTVDPQGFLWVLDPAAPGNEFIKPGGPKLVKIDLATNKVVQVIHFDMTAAPQGSYLNDVRVSPDGKFAYLTDSGQRGALLVVDVGSGQARRILDGDPRTQPQPGIVPHVDGHELRRPDHRIPAFAADGIALDPAGTTLYWQDLVGDTLYSIPTAVMTDPAKTAQDVAAAVQTVATTVVADGLWMNARRQLFITDPADNAVKMRAPDGAITTVATDPRLRWPDSMAEGANGDIYVTASHIPDMAQFHEHGSTQKGQWELFRFTPPPAP